MAWHFNGSHSVCVLGGRGSSQGSKGTKPFRVCQVKKLLQGDILVPGRATFSGVVREGQRRWTGGSRGLDRNDLQGKNSSGGCPVSWDPEEASVMELVSRENCAELTRKI